MCKINRIRFLACMLVILVLLNFECIPFSLATIIGNIFGTNIRIQRKLDTVGKSVFVQAFNLTRKGLTFY